MKIDDANNLESYEEALAEYNEIQKRHARYEYLKNLGTHKRTMQEEAELLGLKILISSEDQPYDGTI